jgi:hypothetical protein
MIDDGHNTYQAKVVESSGPDSSFQVPAGYKKLRQLGPKPELMFSHLIREE